MDQHAFAVGQDSKAADEIDFQPKLMQVWFSGCMRVLAPH